MGARQMERTIQQTAIPPEVGDERKDRGKKYAGVTKKEGRGGQGREENEGMEKRKERLKEGQQLTLQLPN